MKFPFKNLFGLSENEIKPLCILTPFLTKTVTEGLKLSRKTTGKPYTCFNEDRFTLIETRIGPLFAGDAVLHLNGTPCTKILFIGSCGSLNEEQFPIGSVVSPNRCLAMESFTQMLQDRVSLKDAVEIRGNAIPTLPEDIPTAKCASLGSIRLQEKYCERLQQQQVDVVEMECAAIAAAAAAIKRDLTSLLYVTDIVTETSPYECSDPTARQRIEQAQQRIVNLINDQR